MTASESVLSALMVLLETAALPFGALEGATIKRNTAVPEVIPEDGLIIVRDGDPGEAQVFLGSRVVMYEHSIDIEIYAAHGDAAERDSVFSGLTEGLGTVLEANRTITGTVSGFLYGEPSASTEAVEGGHDIKQGIVTLTADYAAATPLG